MNFKNKIVFVSGANRGIGKALIEDLLKRDVQKIYAGTRDKNQLPEFNDLRVIPITLDITNEDQIKAAASRASDTNILINNAGSLNFINALSGPLDRIRQDMEVNYFGTLNMMRYFLPVLQTQQNPVLANVVSVAAFINFPFHGGYCASKAALFSITQGALIELASKGIKVHNINPGPIDTDMSKNLNIDKASPKDTAKAILDGIEAEQAYISPDPMGAEMFKNWTKDFRSLEAISAEFMEGLEN